MEEKTIEPARALSLAGLVDYSPGAVVSRTLIKGPAGNITLFSFDEAGSISEHSAPFDALVYILEGEAELAIGGEPILAQGGDVVLMPKNIPHALTARTRFKMLLVMLKG